VADNALWLRPGFVEHVHGEDALLTTTVDIAHPALLSRPCFEYQHARSEDSAGDALRDGFAQWARTDWNVFVDLAGPGPGHCPWMDITFPGTAQNPGVAVRRVQLGAVTRVMASGTCGNGPQAHPACDGCLFTAAMNTFAPQLHGTGTFGVRLHAARDVDGGPMADRRVNGEDWPAGVEALRAHVRDWPGAGFESRRQYVLIGPAPARG